MEQKHSTMTKQTSFKKRICKWVKGKKSSLIAVLAVGQAGLYGQDFIPPEITSTTEAFRDFLLGDFAVILLGIIWGCACIGFAFNKDSQRGKIAFITITIACLALGLTQVVISQFVGMGS